MARRSVQFQSGSLLLEGMLHSPDQPADAVVVVCHPHPQGGGNMHNNVVIAIAEALVAQGMAALTFNFRGVGRSQGAYDAGAGEQDDAQAAIAFAAGLQGVTQVGLAGYSFGAGVAAAIADAPLFAVALVAPPSARLQAASKLAAYPGPVLLLAGEFDHVASVEALDAASKARSGPTEVVVVSGVDHFWRGAEDLLEETVGAFFARSLPEG